MKVNLIIKMTVFLLQMNFYSGYTYSKNYICKLNSTIITEIDGKD
jgi:hypothetical protein